MSMNKNPGPEEPSQPTYSGSSLFRRIGHTAQKAGIRIVYAVLLMYYTLLEPSTPVIAKMTIIGALAYFVSPIDLFPDLLPGGYSDDVAVIIGALLTVAIYINDVSRKLAREKLHEWFESYDEAELQYIEERLERKNRKNRKRRKKSE